MYEKWSVPLLGGTETTETEGRVWLCEGPFLGTSAAIQQVPLRIVNLCFSTLFYISLMGGGGEESSYILRDK